MTRRSALILLLLVPLWLAASYGVRFALMEDAKWVGLCLEQAGLWQCEVRSGLGYLIHFRVIAGAALLAALVAFFLPRAAGWWLAVLGLFLLPTLAETLAQLPGLSWAVAFGMGLAATTLGHEAQATPAAWRSARDG